MANKPPPTNGPEQQTEVPTEIPKEIPTEQKEQCECKSLRLAIVVGRRGDASIDTAIEWLMNRAKALGGTFHLWVDRTASDPMDKFRDHDISGGRQRSGSSRYRVDRDMDGLLADCQNCKGRIEELVIIHHGSPVDEAVLADHIGRIFMKIKVPVCKVVWWSCNAAVSLDVELGGATDVMMRKLGSVTLAQCEPCGCDGPIELIWPTAGLCYITGADGTLQTNDGKVNRARWGYRQPDGSLGLNPPPGENQSLRRPPDRDPPHGKPPAQGPGTVLGTPVGKHSG